MFFIRDYKIKVSMPVDNRDDVDTNGFNFMCLFGSKADDMFVFDDGTETEVPFKEFVRQLQEERECVEYNDHPMSLSSQYYEDENW